MKVPLPVSILLVLLFLPFETLAQTRTGEGPNLGGKRITQEQVESGLSLDEILDHGQRIFTTPFNKYDGYGDGPYVGEDPLTFGGRNSLQKNGTFLRVNGLDAQTCLECHSIVKNSTVPARLGIGGVGGSGSNAIVLPTYIDVTEGEIDGRFINPPFLFGSGGVELLAKEMTLDLQELKAQAVNNPGTPVPLITKGVSFGTILYDDDGDSFVFTDVEGVDHDLVVKPFGRKGEFTTVREFDVEAMQFHFGIQPVEVVGEDYDDDQDDVENEILAGEISALHIFNTNLPRPVEERRSSEKARKGRSLFSEIGCASCHIPSLRTRSRRLTYSFPEVREDPKAHVFFSVDLRHRAGFKSNWRGGLVVRLFSDLKRHDMGEALAETATFQDLERNREFVTARLWGIRDTAPYLHDGRATTLTDAILMHGGEAQGPCDSFADLSGDEKDDLLAFLYTLRTPNMGSDTQRDFRPPFFGPHSGIISGDVDFQIQGPRVPQ
jgi:hypothetical protein